MPDIQAPTPFKKAAAQREEIAELRGMLHERARAETRSNALDVLQKAGVANPAELLDALLAVFRAEALS